MVEIGPPAAAATMQRMAELASDAADLENAPSNLFGPPDMAALMTSTWRRASKRVKVRVLDARALAKAGMGLLLGVGKGGEKPPCMVVLECIRGGAKKDARRRLMALVGKGITYDTGGLALKPLRGMYGQHGDKSGAAVAAAVFRGMVEAADGDWDFVALLPMAENLVSARSVRPGDVLTACDGTTVEVVNPDAEGRLVLADAMAYAARAYAPDAMIDFATLTAAIFTQNEVLADAAAAAGEATGERVWRMPPWDEYSYETDSPVADTRNSGWSSSAEGYMASLFLRRFVPPSCQGRWLHVDIAKNEASGTSPGAGTGPFVGSGVALGLQLCARLTSSRMSV
jgi:leucyl aminopeptidase